MQANPISHRVYIYIYIYQLRSSGAASEHLDLVNSLQQILIGSRLQGLRRRLDSETSQERTERLAVLQQNTTAQIDSEMPEESCRDNTVRDVRTTG